MTNSLLPAWTLLDLLLLLDILLASSATLWVLYHPREPRAMLAWILAFILLPLFGVLLFLLIGEPRLRRLRNRRRKRRPQGVEPAPVEYIESQESARDSQRLSPSMRRLSRLVTHLTQRPPLRHNQVKIQQDGIAAFDALAAALAAAQDHIHLEFYIFRPDQSGTRIAEILIERAQAGVEVRLLLDFIGSWSLSWRFFRRLRREGVEVGWFMPIIPWRGRWRMNFRNHRKIVIIDGDSAITGSLNIGDEYAGIERSLGQWHDTLVTLHGPVVEELQEIFCEDWYYATRRRVSGARYHPPLQPRADTIAQLVPSGPDQEVRVVQLLIHGLLASARHEICFATPYFIPDAALLIALQGAAYRGVVVRLLLPGRSDHRLSLWAARSYYREICAAGVEISEYPKGMLHSKLVLIDREWAMVGSANMDERSFRLNFEVSLLLYDQCTARTLRDHFAQLRSESIRYRTPAEIQWGFGESLLLGIARLAGPLL